MYKYAIKNRKKENSFFPVCSKNTCNSPMTNPIPAILIKSANSIRYAPHNTTYVGKGLYMQKKAALVWAAFYAESMCA